MKQFIAIIFLILFTKTNYAQNDKITVYFNKWVDNSASPIVDAQRVINIDDTVIAYIDRAQISIDYCVYNTSTTQIITALNNAYNRGVNIRLIHDDDATNSAISGLNQNIYEISNNSYEIMHNKFLVIDIENAEKSKLITGSVNFTYQNLFEDYNNMLIIEDSTIAQTYKNEFNEMWGSTTLIPNTSNSKFGSSKSDNTQHNFNVNGTDIEVYFSPSDGVTSKIENTIYTADYNLYFALLYFTRDDLADAVIDKHNSGIEIKGLIENIDPSYGSEYDNFISHNIDVSSYLNEPGMLHHKYAIIDYNNSSSNPTVITGSHNWSSSAEYNNDENTLIIHDLYIANEFYEEFTSRYNQINSVSELISLDNIKITQTANRIEINSDKIFNINIYNLTGKQIKNINNKTDFTINTFEFSNGVYFLNISNKNISKTIKFISL
jgi:phosphatidylserine/phosphatidylglycerophosphate/cardiolipin synthase-like enzyme